MDQGGVAPGSEVGGYRILAPLGSGGMGTVYRAVDGGGSTVALKLLHPHVGADPAARDRLRREVAALQRLRHPGVAAVLDAEADSTEAFVVTELVDGLTLEAHVARGGPLPAVELAELAAGLQDALAAVHAAGVVHRDLKPSNVMLTTAGPVLIDFGIAQAADDARVTSAGFVVGTPGYLAPELLADEDPSPATDWWGWAAVLAFAATGRAPFGTRPLDAVIARTRAGDVDLAGVPDDVAAPLRAALAPDAARRAGPDDVAGDLARAAARAPAAPPTQVLGGDDAAATRALPAVGAVGAVGAVDEGRSAGAGGPTRVLSQDGATRATAVADEGGPAVVPPHRSHPPSVVPAGGVAPGADGTGDAQGWIDPSAGAAEPAPYVPPRPRRRAGSVLAVAVATVAGGMLYPGLTLVVVGIGLLLLRTVGVAGEALDHRRERRGGPARGDVGHVVATGPWHLVRAAVGLLPSVVVAASVVVVVGGVLWWALQTDRLVVPLGGAPDVNGPLTYSAVLGLAVLLGVVTAWFGPLGRLSRVGARRTLAAVAPGWSGATVLAAAALAAAGVLAVLLVTGQPVTWWPLPGPPDLR